MLRKSTIAVSATLLGALPFTSFANEEANNASAEQQNDMEVIEVTSRKKVESLNKIPVAVSAFTDGMIEQQGLQSLDDIARFSPGLSFSKAFGRTGERPVIRGMSNVLAGVQFGVESGAAYFVDGTYFSGDIQSLDMSNVERIEVVKGPQSALYGRNSYSGAINFITKTPDNEDFMANAKITVAEHGERNVTASASLPLTDWLAASVSVRDYNYDGEWTNTVTGKTIGNETTSAVSAVFDANISDQLHLRWRVQSQTDEDGTRPFYLQPATENNCMPGLRSLALWPASGSTNQNQYYCGEIQLFPIALNDGPDADGIPNPVDGYPLGGFLPSGITFFGNPYSTDDATAFDGVKNESFFTTLSGDYELASGHWLDAAFSYRDFDGRVGSDSDHSSVNFVMAPNSEAFFALTSRDKINDTTAEFKVRSPEGDIEWMAGAFYFKQENQGYDLTMAEPLNGVKENFSSVTNTAIFASVDVKISDKLDATFEARVASEEKVVTEYSTRTGATTFDSTGTWDNFTPRATLNYQVNDETIVYGIVAQGVKPGGFNGIAGEEVGKETYEQEETSSVEVGFKTRSIANMYATVSAYYNQIEHLQLTTAMANPTGALNSIVTNQGEGNVAGFEVDVNVSFSDNLSGRFSYALAASEFTSGCDDFQWTLTSGGGLLTPGTNTGTDFSGGNGDCSIKGNQFPLSSKHQASAFVEYNHYFENDLELFVNTDLSYESKKYVQVHNLAYLPEAAILGARAGIRGENWSATLFVRNLTDEDAPVMATRWLSIPYFSFSSLNVAPDGADKNSPRAFFANPRRGRQMGLELTYNF